MNAAYFPLYVVWSITWLLVLIEYGTAANAGWRADGGRWRDLPVEVARFGRWYLRALRDDVADWWRVELPPIVLPERSGRWLRFAVGLSAGGSFVLGLSTSLVDRSGWSVGQHVTTFGAVAVSLLAAQIHLALAWTHHRRRWTLFALSSVVWLPIGLWVRSLIA